MDLIFGDWFWSNILKQILEQRVLRDYFALFAARFWTQRSQSFRKERRVHRLLNRNRNVQVSDTTEAE